MISDIFFSGFRSVASFTKSLGSLTETVLVAVGIEYTPSFNETV